MSLDGFVAGPAGEVEPLHRWALDPDPADAEILAEGVDVTGVIVLGRRLFDIVDAPDGWNDEMGYGAAHAAQPPMLVVTRTPPETVRLADRVTFVVDGIGSAISKGVTMAGDRDVVIMGGGETIRRALDAGVVDELRLHLAPVLLGGGTPLFGGAVPRGLHQTHVLATSRATHLTYRLDRV